MIPLAGTTNADHMQQDLDVFDFKLDEQDVKRIAFVPGNRLRQTVTPWRSSARSS